MELQKANDIIEQKNKDITDSINYARRIQLGILPPKEVTDACFSDYFILFKPKDIVSGDFYWAVASQNRKTNEKLAIVAAVDCTGHGVPGAFMSMLGNTLLNQTIFHPEIVSPGDVLDFLNEKLPENLKSTGAEQNIRDGMDMGLGIFNFQKMEMEFARANNPCWIVRHGTQDTGHKTGGETQSGEHPTLIEVQPDKQAITASSDAEKKKFTTQTIKLQKGDCVYLFTDGYADQFGGVKGKKFGYRQFRELLVSLNNKAMAEQKAALEKSFEAWKENLEQVDDVCVIGIRV
jgi:serine phosphatase RsbU (regulator of sigma subunit)